MQKPQLTQNNFCPAPRHQPKIGDLDLLQEYGLDFNKFSLSNGNAAAAAVASSSRTQLPEPLGFGVQRAVKSPSNWTKFD